MPKTSKELPRTIGFRVTDADIDKLNSLAELTCRRPAEVLRLLLRRARFQGEDLIVGTPMAEGAAHDVR
jgi:hypothetical protein